MHIDSLVCEPRHTTANFSLECTRYPRMFLEICIQVESHLLLQEDQDVYHHHLEEEVECKLSRSYILSTRDTTNNLEPYLNALTAP
jgi:hypothetical protein